jgi:hypothetical protein
MFVTDMNGSVLLLSPPASHHHMHSALNSSLAPWRDGQKEESRNGFLSGPPPHVAKGNENHLSNQVETTLPSYQSIHSFSSDSQRFPQGPKSIEKEEIHGLHDELRPLLWKPRLEGLNNINLNAETPPAVGPSTQILPTPTSTEVNGDDFRGENNEEASDAMSTMDDADLSGDGGQQNGVSDQMSEKRKGKRFR